MIRKDIYQYTIAEFSRYLEPISVLSRSAQGKILVKDDRALYNFDRITENVYGNVKVPSSADALLVTEDVVLLTEFKSGFKRVISEETIDYNRLTCPDDSTKQCMDYANLLLARGRLEINELLDSLKFKAIESYVTLDKQVFFIIFITAAA